MKRFPARRYGLLVAFVLLAASLVTLAQRTPRVGVVKPRRGPLAGKEIRYGGDDRFSQVAEFTAEELEAFIRGKKTPPPRSLAFYFVKAIKERDLNFESQLSREGVDRYPELMKWCLEDGEFEKDLRTCRYRAPFFIGIDLETGKPIKEYMAENRQSAEWLIEPGWVK